MDFTIVMTIGFVIMFTIIAYMVYKDLHNTYIVINLTSLNEKDKIRIFNSIVSKLPLSKTNIVKSKCANRIIIRIHDKQNLNYVKSLLTSFFNNNFMVMEEESNTKDYIEFNIKRIKENTKPNKLFIL